MESLFSFDNYKKKPKIPIIKGDFIDRLHGKTTISLLFITFMFLLFRQTLYSKIQCWTPTYLSGTQGEYLTQFCWINSTYLFPDEYESETYAAYHHHQTSVPYYQYIFFIK